MRRGGRKALPLRVAHYFHLHFLCFPASRKASGSQWGCLQKGQEGIYASAALPTLSLQEDHSATHSPLLAAGVAAKGGLGLAAITYLCSGFTRRAGRAAGVSQVGQKAWLATVPVESPDGLFFLISLAKSGDPCCPHRPTWQLLEEPDMCQVVRGFSCSQARIAAVERTGEVQAERTAALYICHIKLRAPSLALYQLLACC